MKKRPAKILICSLLVSVSILVNAQTKDAADFFNQLSTERVASDNTILWEQVAPGNAGFANLVRYHPTIPGLVVLCPDMWNIYQSNNNGAEWYSMKDPDGNGDFYHIRDLYYSPSDANFGLAIESSRLWKTEDTGQNWTNLTNCPWYTKDADGYDKDGWRKKVASLAIDPNNKNVWFVGGGSNVRGQEWLSCYQEITAAQPHGTSADNEGKLWRTKDAGSSWTLVNAGMDTKAQVGRIIVNPKNSQQVFASSNYGLYRSDNGGTSWTQISAGKLDNDIVMDMDFYYNATTDQFVLYLIDQIQYHANGNTTKCTGGIFKSTDNGDNWTNITGDLGLDINQLTGGTPANYYKYIAKWFGITEAAAKSAYPTLPTHALQCFNMLSVDPSRESALYIGFADPQIANSIVPGRVWTTSNDGQKWINTARLYGDIWANDKAYWESRDNPYHENMKVGHESPHMQSGNDYALRSTRGIAVGVDGSVMMISDHSTMLSTDHGETWNQMDEDYTADGNIIGHGNSNLPALTIGQDKRYETAILGSGEHRVWIPTNDSPDDRQALKFIKSAQETVISMAFDPYDNQTIYSTSSRQANKQNIFRSSDGGLNWGNYGVATPATNAWGDDFYTNALTIDPIDNKYFYFGITSIKNASKENQGGFYFSDNQGKTFSQRNNGLPSPSRIKDIEFDPRDDTRASLFVAAEKNAFSQETPVAQGGLYHSSNRGENWTKVNTPSSVEGVNYIVIDHTNRMYITTGYRGAGDGVWYTDDFGTTWNQVFKYAGAECIDISPYDHNLLVVTVEYLSKNPGVFVSRDRGLSWVKSNKTIGSPNHIEDIKFNIQNPSELWLATLGCGFYKGEIENGSAVQAVSVSPKVIEYNAGDDKQITAEIIQNQYANETIVWKSDNPAVVTVDQYGLITPVNKGKATIWATISNDRFSDNCVVVVHENTLVGIKDILDPKNQTPTKENVFINPNIVSDSFSISGANENSDVNIYSMHGSKVLETKNTREINISDFKAGVYIVEILFEQARITKKIVKI
ncbi:VPS10 domain-containing protein [Labilibaculum antarcticum]|uniref:BIG2 domain-containing protein n=1 Tax=Labilibaculum antarcticum TaxID=1717717 RepID=A0A1Y1CN67_9BACT|nr:Ig-like domain-containing protein [Labilibaculum antarcticum]BAX81868.1 hypothetical protein ALGA_3570 [Labilibaculum antarcticum]